MVHLYYDLMLLMSFVLLGRYLLNYNKHFDIHITLAFIVVPVSVLGYFMQGHALSADAYLGGLIVDYIGGCFLPLLMTFALMGVADIKLPPLVRPLLLVLTAIIFSSVLTIGHLDIFYKSIDFQIVNGVVHVTKEYGYMHSVYLAMIIAYFIMTTCAVVYARLKRKYVSATVIYPSYGLTIVTLLAYVVGRAISDIEMVPLAYNLSLMFYLFVVHRFSLYDIDSTAIDALVEAGEVGFVSLDLDFNYLASNKAGRKAIPALRGLRVDKPLPSDDPVTQTVLENLRRLADEETPGSFVLETGDTYYSVDVRHLYAGRAKGGYQLFIVDDTARQTELTIANNIQMGALPKQFPAFPGIDAVDLYACMDPAKEVGGDFYDFFRVDDDTVAFLIADVAGKGIPGALFMMVSKAEIQNHLSQGDEVDVAIRKANEYLCEHNEAGMFVTVWAATLDWRCGLLTYVDAGHNPPLLRHGRGGAWEWLRKRGGFPLGAFDTATYRQRTLTLEPGDEILLYTDGVNEAFSASEEEYGNDRLEEFVTTHADLRPEELVRGLRASVAAWAEGAEQSDDLTILSVEYKLEEA